MSELPGIHGPGPIRDVREGMTVVDASGEELGTVEEIRMGDPEAVTGSGQEMHRDAGLVQDIAQAFAGDNPLSEQEQARLLRTGFLRVDRKGVFSGDDYVAADRIERVEGDRVYVGARQAG